MLQKKDDVLDYWIKKLVVDKTLIPLKKGLYISKYYYDIVCAQDSLEKEKYLLYLANVIRFPSYISLEYILSKNSFIPETSFAITSITVKSTRNYTTDIGKFYYKNIKQDLFYGYNTTPFKDKQIWEASLAKALFDFLYIKPFKNSNEMKNYLTISGRFNWKIFDIADKNELVEIITQSQSNKMQRVLTIIKKNNLL